MTNTEIAKGSCLEVSLLGMQNHASSFLNFLKANFKSEIANRSILVVLKGNLGAGKTTFSQEIAKLLGVTEPVTSPTFVIQKTYRTTDSEIERFVHIDAYRLENSKELSVLGFESTLCTAKGLVFLEWPEKVPEYGLKADLTIVFDVLGEDKRRISVL